LSLHHLDGHKKNGGDGKDDKFGKSTVIRRLRARPAEPIPTPKKIRIPKEGDVEVHLGLDGLWKPVRPPRFANQFEFEIETIASQEFEQKVAIRECREPAPRRSFLNVGWPSSRKNRQNTRR
jgi:hypothetical protein